MKAKHARSNNCHIICRLDSGNLVFSINCNGNWAALSCNLRPLWHLPLATLSGHNNAHKKAHTDDGHDDDEGQEVE